MIDNFTIVHAELLVLGILIVVALVQLVLMFVSYMNQLHDRAIIRRNLKLKEQRKRIKQQQHKKQQTADTDDALDKFAGLVKPDHIPEESLDTKGSMTQEELPLEAEQTEEKGSTTPTAATEKPKTQKDNTQETTDAILEQKKTYTHQDTLDTLRNEALRAKEKGQVNIYEKKLIEGLSLEPEYPEFIKLLADHYFQSNHYKKALALLKRLLDHDKTNHRAMWQMGEIYLSHGDIKTAEIMIEQAVKHQQNNPRYLYSLVDIKYNTGKIDDAVYLMERILKLRPTNVEYLLATAMLYEQKEEFDRARRYYATILEYDPDNHTAKHKLKEI